MLLFISEDLLECSFQCIKLKLLCLFDAFLVTLDREALAFHARPFRSRFGILRRVMRESGQRFTITQTVDQYIQLYEEILGEKVT